MFHGELSFVDSSLNKPPEDLAAGASSLKSEFFCSERALAGVKLGSSGELPKRDIVGVSFTRGVKI